MGALVSFDEQYPICREVAGLSDAAFRLNTSAFFWCFRNTTDGFIPAEDLPLVCPGLRNPEKLAAECVHRRCWHPARESCGTGHCPPPRDEDGWIIHDYLRDRPSKDEATATRAGKSDGGSLGNHRRWHADKGVVKAGCPFCVELPPAMTTDSHKRSDNRRAPDHPTESGANPTRADQSLSLSLPDPYVVDHLPAGSARADSDDPILRTIIESIRERTGQTVTADHAQVVAASILGGRHPSNPAAYVRRAITAEPNPAQRFLPVPPPAARPPWCGDPDCNEQTRMREKPDGTPYRCPDCGVRPAEPTAALPAQAHAGRPRKRVPEPPSNADCRPLWPGPAPPLPGTGSTANGHAAAATGDAERETA